MDDGLTQVLAGPRTPLAFLLFFLLAAPLLIAQAQSAKPSPTPLIRSEAREVLVDVVVKNSKGLPVRDLPPGAFQVFENARKQQITSVKFIDGREVRRLGGTSPGRAESAAGAAMDPERREVRDLHLISFVFHALSPEGRKMALAIATQFLNVTQRPETYAGVFVLAPRLTPVQPYTQDKDDIRAAVHRVVAAAERGASPGGDSQIFASQREPQPERGWDSDAALLSINQSNSGDPRMQAVMKQMMLFNERVTRYQLSTRALTALLALMKSQEEIVGRKTVLYFSTGLPFDPSRDDLFQAIISTANRANVSLYGIDVNPLTSDPELATARARVSRAAADSATLVTTDANPAPSDFFGAEDALAAMHINPRQSMRHLVEATGGKVIQTSMDTGKQMEEILDDANTHYELTYRPANTLEDGTYRQIAVKVGRRGLIVRARDGYFALPPLPGQVVLPFEAGVMRLMQDASTPRALPLRAAVLRMGRHAGRERAVVVVEVPQKGLTLLRIEAEKRKQQGKQDHKPETKLAARVALVALLKDEQGRVVEKVSRDLPFSIPELQKDAFSSGSLVMMERLLIDPGRYVLESGVLDTIGKQFGMRRTSVVIPKAGGLEIGDLVFVKQLKQHQADAPSEDAPALSFGPWGVFPALYSNFQPRRGVQVGIYCTVQPDGDHPSAAVVTASFQQNGKEVLRLKPEIRGPDADGAFQVVAYAPGERFQPGEATLWLVAQQGAQRAEKGLTFKIGETPPQ